MDIPVIIILVLVAFAMVGIPIVMAIYTHRTGETGDPNERNEDLYEWFKRRGWMYYSALGAVYILLRILDARY